MKKRIKVAVGLSGGVDSAVAAALLKEQGYDVVGVFLECWQEPGCRTDPDRKDVIKIGLKLGIPIKILDYKKEYKKEVIEWFYKQLRQGKTPNPDILCNSVIKFGRFRQWAEKQGFEYIATGHYCRIEKGKLMMAKDKVKDQTYFLARLSKQQLGKVLFPVGEKTKIEVRRLAKKKGLHVWNKRDSSGLCMINQRLEFSEFLKREIKEHEGEVVAMQGEVVGKHKGHEFYTIGQRHGFKVLTKSVKRPKLYVVRKEVRENRLVVGDKEDLQRKSFEVEKWSWIDGKPRDGRWQCRIRHGGKLVSCELMGKQVELKQAVEGVASGQVCVVYSGENCLGGGEIKS